MPDNPSDITRRTFLRTAAAGVAAAGFVATAAAESPSPAPASAASSPSAKVVSVRSSAAFKGTDLDPAVVGGMLSAGIKEFSGTAPNDFWASLFTPDDVVGIKLNCISRTARPNKPLIDAVVSALKSAGVKENNIIIWDRFEDQLSRRARLTLNTGAEGVRIYGTEKGNGLLGYDNDIYYDTGEDTPEYRSETGTRSLVTKIITTDCTKIINLPVLKDHNVAGVTACLKNLAFGAVNNTARFHKAPMYCSPAIADIMSIPVIRRKTVLHVLDALRVCYNGGPDASNPAFISNFGTVYIATDPVACDMIALEVVQKLRADASLPDLFETSGHPVHVADAAKKGLGVGDRAAINLVETTV